MEEKREKIRELSQTAWSILNSYDKKVKNSQISEGEAKIQAIDEISKLRYGPEMKDYFWIHDTNCKMIFHPYRPEMNGTDISNYEDPTGKRLFVEMNKTIRTTGSGYIDYMWQWKNNRKKIVPKISFVILFKPWGWVLGTGIYIEDINEEIEKINKKIYSAGGIILLIMLIISSHIISGGIKRENMRLRAEKALKKSYEEMENKVAERTYELQSANKTLNKVIEERMKINESLKESQQLLQKTFTSLQAAVIIFRIEADGSSKIVDCNPAATRIFGYAYEELIGKNKTILLTDETIFDEFENLLDKSIKEKGYLHLDEFRLKRKDGNIFIGEPTVSPLIDDKKKIIGWVGVFRDLTEKKNSENERKNLESQLLQAQKLESIGQLAAGIAHEINTPIQYIGDNTHFLSDAFKEIIKTLENHEEILKKIQTGHNTGSLISEAKTDAIKADIEYLKEEVPKAIEQTLEGVKRVSEIVISIKEFSHPGADKKEETGINHVIENAINISRNVWKKVAEMETDFDDSIPLIRCFPGELNQVFLNLIINAADAIKARVNSTQNGTITVKTLNKDSEVEIRITDTGTGIPESIRERVFDPFFTTKDVGAGIGQGLSIAHSVIVKKHNGTIDFVSDINKGTTFIINLPVK